VTVLHRIAPRWWALGLLFVTTACAGAGGSSGPSPSSTRAAAGDTVSLVQYHVRPDGRARFEQFVQESYWPAVRQVARTNPGQVRGFLQTRIIYPVRADQDGTWTYVFLLDPVVSGDSYSMRELLQQVYPDDADQRYQTWAQTWARPFTSQVFVQSNPSATGTQGAGTAP
jgi:hypothetical protein